MRGKYNSFLVRCWRWDGISRIVVEHVQTRSQTRVTSLEEALSWMTERALTSGENPPAAPTRRSIRRLTSDAGIGDS